MAQFLLSPSQFPFAPLAVSLSLPFVPLSTYLAPSSCDRNRPPPSQVACKLTLFAPPFTQLSHPFQLPRTPTTQRLTMTTLGPFRSCYAEQLYILFHIEKTIKFHLLLNKIKNEIIFQEGVLTQVFNIWSHPHPSPETSQLCRLCSCWLALKGTVAWDFLHAVFFIKTRLPAPSFIP